MYDIIVNGPLGLCKVLVNTYQTKFQAKHLSDSIVIFVVFAFVIDMPFVELCPQNTNISFS